MDVPGNSSLLLILLVLFVACTAYAAGRLHQWHRTVQDRDEAYRDGYDTATRSVFSLAARVIGPRRERAAIRASASVRPSSPPVAATPKPAAPTVATPDLVAPGLVAPNLVSPSVVAPDLIAPGLAVPGLTMPTVTAPGSAVPSFGVPGLGVPSFGVPGVGVPGSEAPDVSASASALAAASSGRHGVPDELVRATTYRLAPDRVARAKVRPALPAEAPEGGSRASAVPKPRSS